MASNILCDVLPLPTSSALVDSTFTCARQNRFSCRRARRTPNARRHRESFPSPSLNSRSLWPTSPPSSFLQAAVFPCSGPPQQRCRLSRGPPGKPTSARRRQGEERSVWGSTALTWRARESAKISLPGSSTAPGTCIPVFRLRTAASVKLHLLLSTAKPIPPTTPPLDQRSEQIADPASFRYLPSAFTTPLASIHPATTPPTAYGVIKS